MNITFDHKVILRKIESNQSFESLSKNSYTNENFLPVKRRKAVSLEI